MKFVLGNTQANFDMIEKFRATGLRRTNMGVVTTCPCCINAIAEEEPTVLVHTDCVRQYLLAPRANAQSGKSQPPRFGQQRSGHPWMPYECEHVAEAFKAGMSIEQLAKRHGRSEAAISSQLIKQGLIKA